MFAILRAFENGNEVFLCFDSKESAQDFKEYVIEYIRHKDTTGKNAYWMHKDEEIIQCDIIPKWTKKSLERKYIELMNRLEYHFAVSNRNEAILFRCNWVKS